MEYKNINVQTENGISTITIERPDVLNALNKETIQELSEAFKQLEDANDTRVVVLTGCGKKAFVAGADIKEFKDFNSSEGQNLAKEGQTTLFDRIENLKKPVIAAINGYALGGGLELAMACHIRIASDNAVLGLPEVSLGLIPGYGGTQRLPQLIGKGRAMQAIFTAEKINADKALQIGLVNDVYTQDNLLEEVYKLAIKIARNSSSAITAAITAINVSGTEQGFIKEQELFGKQFDSTDFKEGTDAFLNKRRPNF